jgi:hypothetical protein
MENPIIIEKTPWPRCVRTELDVGSKVKVGFATAWASSDPFADVLWLAVVAPSDVGTIVVSVAPLIMVTPFAFALAVLVILVVVACAVGTTVARNDLFVDVLEVITLTVVVVVLVAVTPTAVLLVTVVSFGIALVVVPVGRTALAAGKASLKQS